MEEEKRRENWERGILNGNRKGERQGQNGNFIEKWKEKKGRKVNDIEGEDERKLANHGGKDSGRLEC